MIGLKLKLAREKAGISAADCAKEIGLTVHAYRRWERGEVEPRVSQAITLAELFGCTLDELLSDRPAEENAQRMMVSVQPGQRVLLDVTGVELQESKPYTSHVRMADSEEAAAAKPKRK